MRSLVGGDDERNLIDPVWCRVGIDRSWSSVAGINFSLHRIYHLDGESAQPEVFMIDQIIPDREQERLDQELQYVADTTDAMRPEISEEELEEIPSKQPLHVRADGYFLVKNIASGSKYYRGRVLIGLPGRERALMEKHRRAQDAIDYAKSVVNRYYRLFYWDK